MNGDLGLYGGQLAVVLGFATSAMFVIFRILRSPTEADAPDKGKASDEK
jgi:hypothetical protein